MERETANELAELVHETVAQVEPIIRSQGGIHPEGGMQPEFIADMLEKLGTKDGDSIGSGRVNFEREVFDDGSGESINVTYDLGTIHISPSGRVVRYEV